jgi:ribosomal protein S18 acetylase RimI-like enzyme
MTVTIRPAHAEELTRVGELTVEAYANDGFVTEEDGYAEHLRDAATRAREAEVYVATLPEARADVAGTVTFFPQGSPWCELAGPGEGEFRMLAVDPSARGRGAARSLVQRCIDRCTELGLDELVICSMPTMTPAHRLYYSLGFSRDESLDWDVHEELRLWGFRAGVPPYV